MAVPAEKVKAKRFRKPGYRSYIPLDGFEKGVPHFYFNEREINKLFSGFDKHLTLYTAHSWQNKRGKRYGLIGIKR